ncbi:MAG TPA: ABC transporter permease [Vicinamibacterales bacterium]
MLKDLRHGMRTLLQAKGWTTVVVLSLALGIGANAAIFSGLNGLLLTKIPVQDPDSLVRLRWVGRNDMVNSSSDYGSINRLAYGNQNVRTTFSYPMYRQLLADNKTMSDLFACAPFGRVNAVVDGQAELAQAFLSTGNYFQLLGVSARIGRTIVPDDDRPTATPVAVISSKYWHSRFGTEPNVVGKVIRVNNVPVTIVGILPPDFTGVQQPLAEAPDLSLPLALEPQLETFAGNSQVSDATYWWLQIMGRLKPGATAAQVQGNLEGVFQSTARAGFDAYMKGLTDADRSQQRNRDRTRVPRLFVEAGGRGVYDVNSNDLQAATILTIVVALVLLIVCANVANLLLSRATTRQKEISVRMSLGATRWRLVRQLLTESVLLAAIGGVLGLVVGYWGRALMPTFQGQPPPLDWRVFAFVAVVTLGTGILFGIVPALRGTAVNVNAALKETGRSVIGSRSVLGRILLVVQVAISLVLLVGAGLFLQTLGNLRKVDVGFDPRNLVLFRVNPSLNRYDEKQMTAFYGNMLERLSTVPGVRGAAMSQPALLSGGVNSTGIYVQGRPAPLTRPQDDSHSINRLVISPNFFDVMGIPVVSGRAISDRDTATSPKVVVINEAAVRKYFPNENPLGHHFGSSPETVGDLEIVGVLRDAKYNSVREAAPPTMYVPYRQARLSNATIEVRTAMAPAGAMTAIREAVRQIDPNLPLTDVSTQIEQVEKRFQQEKLFAQAYTLFGGIALLLAAIGLFGLMSYNVSRRTNEIGIRMALGAQRSDVLGLVMRESMVLVAIGVAAGLAIALLSSRLVTTLLYGLAPRDPLAMSAAIGVMIAVSALAGYLPARRASRVDPMVALHYE